MDPELIPTPAELSPPPRSAGVGTTPTRARGQAGQSTVEYALILLGAAAVALVVVAWVTRTDLIGRLFDSVVGRILQQAG
jgi:hypothetical protein